MQEAQTFWYRKAEDVTDPGSYIFCVLSRFLEGIHPTHSMDPIIRNLEASGLPQCQCYPYMHRVNAPKEREVVRPCSCQGLFRVVVHPRHGPLGPARNNGPGASLIVLRASPKSKWEVELGVTETRSVSFKGDGVRRLYLYYSFCMKRKWQPGIERRKAVHDAFGIVRKIIEPALTPYVIQLGPSEESQMVAPPDVIAKLI
jgi:hypothetical protein